MVSDHTVFLALLEWMARCDVGERNRGVLAAAYDKYHALGTHEVQICVGMCQLSRMHDEEHARLTLHFWRRPSWPWRCSAR